MMINSSDFGPERPIGAEGHNYLLLLALLPRWTEPKKQPKNKRNYFLAKLFFKEGKNVIITPAKYLSITQKQET